MVAQHHLAVGGIQSHFRHLQPQRAAPGAPTVQGDLAARQYPQTTLAVERQVHRAGGIEFQAGTVRQGQIALLAGAAAAIRHRPLHPATPRHQGAGAGQTEQRQGLAAAEAARPFQGVAGHVRGQLTQAAGEPFHLGPGALVARVRRQPGGPVAMAGVVHFSGPERHLPLQRRFQAAGFQAMAGGVAPQGGVGGHRLIRPGPAGRPGWP